MFKSVSFLSLFALSLTGSVVFGDDDELFSDVSTRSVFEDVTDTVRGSAAIPKRITGAETLRDLLNSSGFDAKVNGSDTVTLTKKLDPWEFPVSVRISDDESRLTISLGLRTIKDASQLSTATLISMMDASRKNGPDVFTWNSDRARTELYRVTDNKGLTGQSLRDMINRMAVVAKQNEKIWAAPAEEKTAPAKTTPAAPTTTATPKTPATPSDNTTPNTTSGVTTASLIGKWSAARSKTEAFAVEFKADGSFNLVYINSGKQTKSSGQFTITGDSLTLAGTGLKLVGKVTLKSAKEFTFTAEKSAALTFTKAP